MPNYRPWHCLCSVTLCKNIIKASHAVGYSEPGGRPKPNRPLGKELCAQLYKWVVIGSKVGMWVGCPDESGSVPACIVARDMKYATPLLLAFIYLKSNGHVPCTDVFLKSLVSKAMCHSKILVPRNQQPVKMMCKVLEPKLSKVTRDFGCLSSRLQLKFRWTSLRCSGVWKIHTPGHRG